MYHHMYENFSIPQSEADQMLAGKHIPAGYVNASQMCKANGKRFANYMQNKTGKAYAEAVLLDTGIPVSSLFVEIEGTPNGDSSLQGTWVHPDVAIHVGQWISPAFSLWCNRVLLKVLDPNFESERSAVSKRKNASSIVVE